MNVFKQHINIIKSSGYDFVNPKILSEIFFKEKEEIGRIIGYSSAEMFWWQVDEILDRD